MPKQSHIDAARILIEVMEREGKKIPPYMHNLANAKADRVGPGEDGATEVQYRLMVRENGTVRDHLGLIVNETAGMQRIIERMSTEPDKYASTDEAWIERREVTITPWSRAS